MARAIDFAQKALSLNEKDAINHAVLAYLLALTKQHDKAIVISPNFSVENWQYNLAFKNNDQVNLTINALRKAGPK